MNSSSTDAREIRKFGAVALIFFGLVAALGFWRHRPLAACFFGLLSLLGAGFLFLPGTLAPLHAGWLRVAHIIGRVMTALILTLAYYLVMTPSALIKRCFGGRPLPTRPDPNASTYWVSRSEPGQDKERFLKRF